MKVFFILFTIVVVYAIMVTVFCFYRNPLPFPDRGHRCFAVPDEKAAKVVVGILDKIGGLSERFTFDFEPTHQTLLWDNTTVIIHHDNSSQDQDLNGLSIVVKDPERDALRVAEILIDKGYTAIIDKMNGDNKIVNIKSNICIGWRLVLRRHILVMGKPKNLRKILE